MIYLFTCKNCGREDEVFARVKDRPTVWPCVQCGAIMGRKYVPPVIVEFRGYGFDLEKVINEGVERKLEKEQKDREEKGKRAVDRALAQGVKLTEGD